MFGKENHPELFLNYNKSNNEERRTPLKNFSLNTFNFIFSSNKNKESNKKLLQRIPVNKASEKKFKFELTTKDINDIFSEINKNNNESKKINEEQKTQKLLNLKRKRNFITINSLNRKKNFIKYSVKNKKNNLNNFEEQKTIYLQIFFVYKKRIYTYIRNI